MTGVEPDRIAGVVTAAVERVFACVAEMRMRQVYALSMLGR